MSWNPPFPLWRSLSFPDAVVVPASLSLPEDYKPFQDLLRMIAVVLQISLEEVQDPTHKFLDILQTTGPGKVALPINKGILGLAKALWHMPPTFTPTPKRLEK